MVDYMNGIDMAMYPPVIYKSHWYSLTPSVSYGNLFISFSIDKNLIDLEEIKSRSFILKPGMLLSSLTHFNFVLFQSISNLDEKYNYWMQHKNCYILYPTALFRGVGMIKP